MWVFTCTREEINNDKKNQMESPPTCFNKGRANKTLVVDWKKTKINNSRQKRMKMNTN